MTLRRSSGSVARATANSIIAGKVPPRCSRYATALRHSQLTRSGSGATAGRPRWQTLYLRPDPHQHGALRAGSGPGAVAYPSAVARSWFSAGVWPSRRHRVVAPAASPRSASYQASRSSAGGQPGSARTASRRCDSASSTAPRRSQATAASSRATARSLVRDAARSRFSTSASNAAATPGSSSASSSRTTSSTCGSARACRISRASADSGGSPSRKSRTRSADRAAGPVPSRSLTRWARSIAAACRHTDCSWA